MKKQGGFGYWSEDDEEDRKEQEAQPVVADQRKRVSVPSLPVKNINRG